MNVSSSSSPFTSSPVNATSHSRYCGRSTTSTQPSVIPLHYNYQTMAPSLNFHFLPLNPAVPSEAGRNVADSETSLNNNSEPDFYYNSLFGDPILPPPPEAFSVCSTSSSLHPRRDTVTPSRNGSPDDPNTLPFERNKASSSRPRLFSQEPYTSVFSRKYSNSTIFSTNLGSPSPPRLKPPDIHIQPNSSNTSNSETHNSPNSTLLMPQDIYTKSSRYQNPEESNQLLSKSEEIFEQTGFPARRMSSILENIPNQLNPSNSTLINGQQMSLRQQFSTDSFSSGEWFRGAAIDYPEFSRRMPTLRPSSKNVLSIKKEQVPIESPVAAIINDSSNGSSNTDDCFPSSHFFPLEKTELTEDSRDRNYTSSELPSRQSISSESTVLTARNYIKQRHKGLPAAEGGLEESLPETETASFNQNTFGKTSPVIFTDSITTGGEYRMEANRLHKKSAFTVLSEKSTSAPPLDLTSPPTSNEEPEEACPESLYTRRCSKYANQKSLSDNQLKLPYLLPSAEKNLLSSDSPRPSVQFDMSGNYVSGKMLGTQKGILLPNRRASLERRRNSSLPSLLDDIRAKAHRKDAEESLPLITNSYHSSIPRLNQSIWDLGPEIAVIPPGSLPRPLKPNPNPTRKQKGLLRVYSNDDSQSFLTPEDYNWGSADDIWMAPKKKPVLPPLPYTKARRRSSSTSPSRRSSTLTTSDRRSSNLSTLTTSDFSYRQPSIGPKTKFPEIGGFQAKRKPSLPIADGKMPRRSISYIDGLKNIRRRTLKTKVAKPTTLSPILGTPNKESLATGKNQADFVSDSISESTSNRGSISIMPLRGSVGNSRSNSRTSSRMHSQTIFSRSTTPLKDILSQFTPSGRSSQAATATATDTMFSQTASKTTSKTNSRINSRSVSQASTRPVSLPNSRPHSRIEQMLGKDLLATSRSTSRLSLRSSGRGMETISPSLIKDQRSDSKTSSSKINVSRRKSISLSPEPRRSRSVSQRRGSISPTIKKTQKDRNRSRSRGAGRTPEAAHDQRRDSLSRIPISKQFNRSDLQKRRGSAILAIEDASNLKRSKSHLIKRAKDTYSLVRKSASAKTTPVAAHKLDTNLKRKVKAVGNVGRRLSVINGDKISLKNNKNLTGINKPVASRGEKDVGRKIGTTVATASVVQNVRGKMATGDGNIDSSKKTTVAKKSGLNQQQIAQPATSKSQAKSAGNKVKVVNKAEQKLPSASAVKEGKEKEGATQENVAPSGADLKRQSSTVSAKSSATGRHPSVLSKKRSDSSLSKRRTDSRTSNRAPLSDLEEISDTSQQRTSAGGDKSNEGGRTSTSNAKQQGSTSQEKSLEEERADSNANERSKTYDQQSIASSVISAAGKNSTGGAGKGHVSVSRQVTAADLAVGKDALAIDAQTIAEQVSNAQISPAPRSQPIEAAVSILNPDSNLAAPNSVISNGSSQMEQDSSTQTMAKDSASELKEQATDRAMDRNNHRADTESGIFFTSDQKSGTNTMHYQKESGRISSAASTNGKRRSPDGQGGSQADILERSDSQEYLEGIRNAADSKDIKEEAGKTNCCQRCFCGRFCVPCCRRCRHIFTKCCRPGRRRKDAESQEATEPVLSATSSATTTHLEVVDERASQTSGDTSLHKSQSCWSRLFCCRNCCRRKKRDMTAETSTSPPSQSKCGLCLSKLFCCRSVNKIDPKTGDDREVQNCCFCIPCRRKRDRHRATAATDSTTAWQDPEQGAVEAVRPEDQQPADQDAPVKQGCCRRFCNVLCCRKKKVQAAEARRSSIKPPPQENARRRLHIDLVEPNSKMKGAIPVLPLPLAWFCTFCNVVVPGLGTLFSGFFCICIGIPRFSQYDSAKARLGSFIINIIVAVAQLFCVLFCFVGWGWSIWWGTIMLKCARKLSKIRKVERLEREEEKRQAQAAALAAAAASGGNAPAETAKT